MPQIITNKEGGTILYTSEDFLSGINQIKNSSYDDFIGRELTDDTTNFNPYFVLGAACPGVDLTALTNENVVTGYITNFVVKNAYAYGITTTGVLHKIDISTNTITNAGDWPFAITGATGEDVALYNVGTNQYVFFSWYDGTNGDVGLTDLAGNFYDDWISVTAAGGTTLGKDHPLPLIVGDDDVLYIGDGRNLHAFDGQNGVNGTLTANRLQIPADYVITSFAKLPDTLVIFAYKYSGQADGTYLGEAKAFFWDYLLDDPYKVVDLADNYVDGGFTWNGTVGCFTQGRQNSFMSKNYTSLKLWNGQTFETVENINDNPPIKGAVQVYQDFLLFQCPNATYSYGKVFNGLTPTLHKINTGGIGGLKQVSNLRLYKSTNSNGVRATVFEINKFGTSDMFTIARNPGFPEGMKGRVKAITVEFQYSASGGRAFSLYLLKDGLAYNGGGVGDFQIINSITTVDDTNMIKTYRETTDNVGLPEFKTLGLFLNWSTGSGNTDAPKVKSVRIDYENINI